MKKVLVSFIFVSLCLVTMSLPASAATYTSGNTTITTSGTIITVSPNPGTNGAMKDYTYSDAISWVSSSITTIVINSGVTHIGAYAFASADNVTTIRIPLSVTSSGEYSFFGCSKMANVYYEGSPNDWASITFDGYRANPFVSATSVSNRKFYFNGCEVGTQMLTFNPGLTEIKDYTFYNAKVTDVNIPGSVTRIGDYALRCSVSGTVCINRATPPTTGTNAITYGGSAKLYVPSGSVNTYNAKGKPWKDNSTEYGPGATAQAVSGSSLGTYGANVAWRLGEDGVLTFDASNPSASKNITIDAASTAKMPWYYFRRLVHTLKLTGGITAINNTLHYHYGISELIIDQPNIPSISTTYIATSSTTPYASLFDPCHPLTLNINLSTLLSSTESAKLETAPWNDDEHWQIALTEKVIVNDADDNTDLLNTVKTYISAPFTMQLGRSMSSAYYNTFCSPIPMNATTIADVFGATADVRELTSTTYDEVENNLTLNFSSALSSIVAGKPYFIKPSKNVSNPIIENVDPATVISTRNSSVSISGTPKSYLTAHGILAPYTPTTDEYGKHFLFLLANNQLTWAKEGTLNGMRAFLILSDDAPSQMTRSRTAMRMPDTATGFDQIFTSDEVNNCNVQKIIENGQLFIIRDGKTYNAMGQIIL